MIYPQLHCGFYLHGNKIYISREDLLDEMVAGVNLREKIHNIPADVRISRGAGRETIYYCFNETVFKTRDWSKEPEQTLKQLYVERCQQLRDKYDYLILSYSGGADSHEILYTFLDNNIFIDEIQVVHYSKALNRFDKNELMKDASIKTLLEFDIMVKPQLKIIADRSPNTKINLLDASDFTVGDIVSNKFSSLGMDKFVSNPSFVTMKTPYTRNYFQHHHNHDHAVRKNNAAFIRGVEKPSLNISDNHLQFRFSDASMHSVKMIQKKDVDDIYTIENFFWTPDCPLIPIKQSHVIKRKLESDKDFYAAFMYSQERAIVFNKADVSPSLVGNIGRRYDELIYYYWNSNMFVAPKPGTRSPEYELVSLIQKDNAAAEALEEYNKFYFKKYAKVAEKELLGKHIFTEPYTIGELNVSWY